MALTGWIAILVVAIMIYLLMKQYETRLVLLGGGLLLCWALHFFMGKFRVSTESCQ